MTTPNLAAQAYAPARRDGHHPQITCNHVPGQAHTCPVPHSVWLTTGQPATTTDRRHLPHA